MKRLIAAIFLLLWTAPAMATTTPVLTQAGVSWNASSGSGAPMNFNVWAATGANNCNNAKPAANDLLLLIVNADSGTVLTFSGTGCTGGYWTSQTSPNAGYRVYTATANGSTDPSVCTISQSAGGIYDSQLFDFRATNGNVPLLDTSCFSTFASPTSVTSCTLTTSVNGEMVESIINANFQGVPVSNLGNQAIPDHWGSTSNNAVGIAHAGVATAGSSLALTATFSGGAPAHTDTLQFAVAANNGSGTKIPAYMVLNMQPNGNDSVSTTAGVMTLPYTVSSPNTPTFPSGSATGATVVAKVLCLGGTCGTITPPAGWTLSLDQLGPSSLTEAADYCHNYTGGEGTQTWAFTGTATQFFIQYAATNIPNGQCTSAAGTSAGSTDIAYTSANAASDSVLVNGLVANNQGQVWFPNDLSGSGYYGTSWGTCQLGGSCDHENYHTDIYGIASGTFTDTYVPPHASWISTAPTSVVVLDTLIGPTVSATNTALWPFP